MNSNAERKELLFMLRAVIVLLGEKSKVQQPKFRILKVSVAKDAFNWGKKGLCYTFMKIVKFKLNDL